MIRSKINALKYNIYKVMSFDTEYSLQELIPRAGEIAQAVKCFLYNDKVPSLYPRNL